MKKSIGLFCILLSIVCSTTAQKWISYTNTDDIRGISVDSKGNKWFATTGGIKKFDGTNWTKYTNTNSGLHLSYISSIAIDKQDRVWAGTREGISVFDGVNWVKYTYENSGFNLRNITSIQVDNSGRVWVATDGYGLFIYDNSNWQTLNTGNSGMPCNDYFQMHIYNEKFYFGSRCGLVTFDGTQWESYNTENSGILQNEIRSVAVSKDGKVYCGSYNMGIFVKDGTTWLSYTSSNSTINTPTENIYSITVDTLNNLVWFGCGLGDGPSIDTLNSSGVWGTFEVPSKNRRGYGVYSIVSMPDSSIWMGTPGGILLYKNKITSDYMANFNEPSYNSSMALKADSTGSIWYGNYTGADKYDGVSWSTFNRFNSPITENVWGILVDEDNNKWFGQYNEVKRYDGVNWISYPIGRTYSSATDKKGTKWFVSMDAGIAKLEAEEITRYNSVPPLISGLVQGLDLDQNGNLWIGTYSGVQKFDGVNWTTYTINNNEYPRNVVNDVLVDKNNNVWFGCMNAVTRFDGTNWTTWYADGISGLAGDYIFDVEEDIDGTIWVGGTGISKFDGTKWITYTTKNSGLVSDYIRRISVDKWGNKWIASGDGGVSFFNDKPIPATPTVLASGATTFCAGENVVLTSSASSGNQWYKDGVAINTNGTSQSFTATETGMYTVKVTVNGYESDPSTGLTITVNPKPVVSFTINSDKQCLSTNNLIFSNNSTITSGTLSYMWNFGNGATSTTPFTSYTYSTSGTYTVTLIASANTGCADSLKRGITIYPNPVSSFSINNASQPLNGNSFVFTNTSTGGSSYLWNFGNGATANMQNVTYSYSAAGNYNVVLQTTSQNGCTNSATKGVSVTASTRSNLYPNTVTCQSFLIGANNLSSLCYTVSKGKVSAITPSTFNYYATIVAPSSTFTMDVVQTISNTAYKFFAVQTGSAKLLNENCSAFLSGNSPSSGQSQFKVTKAVAGRTYIISIVYETKSSIGATSSNSEIPRYTFSARIGTSTLANTTSSISMYPNNCLGAPTSSVASLENSLPPSPRLNEMTTTKSLVLNAFPNPSKDIFNIKVEGSDHQSNGTLIVFNVLGQKMEVINSVKPGSLIQVGRNYGKGNYLVEYRQNTERAQIKLIKE